MERNILYICMNSFSLFSKKVYGEDYNTCLSYGKNVGMYMILVCFHLNVSVITDFINFS